MRWFRSYSIEIFLFLLCFLVYVHNLSHAVYGGDSGDFLSVIVGRSVAHPSGYPLFTLIGIFFSYLPIYATPAWKIGLISAISGSLSVVLFYRITLELTKQKLVAVVSSLTLAFVYTFWLYAEVVEIFMFTCFIILLLFYIGLLYSFRKRIKLFYLLSFLTGLSLSNHLIILVLFPTLFLFVLKAGLRQILRPRVIFIALGFFILGLLPYIYLPIAALHNPPIAWSDPSSLSGFLRYATRQDYNWIPGGGIDFYTRYISLLAYGKYWLAHLPPIVIAISLFGAVSLLWRKSYLLFFSIFLPFLFVGPLYVVYGAIIIANSYLYGVFERFYIFSLLFFLMFFSFGIKSLTDVFLYIFTIRKKTNLPYHYLKSGISMIFLVVPLFLFFRNFPITDLHDVWIGDLLARDLLNSLPKNSILLASSDTLVFNTLYVQRAYHLREDVIMPSPERIDGFIQKNLMLLRSKKELVKKYKTMDSRTINVLTVLSTRNKIPVFSTHKLEVKESKEKPVYWMPYGYIVKAQNPQEEKLSKDEFLKKQNHIWEDFEVTENLVDKLYTRLGFSLLEIPYLYSQGALDTANYIMFRYSELNAAKKYYDKSLKYEPTLSTALQGSAYYYMRKKECKKSEEYLNKSADGNPDPQTTYVLYYFLYADCYKDEKKAKEAKEKIPKEIRKSLEDWVGASLFK